MKVNAKSLAAIKPKNLKQLDKKEKLEKALNHARQLARNTESTMATIKGLDNQEQDLCDVKDIYLQRSENGNKTIEANLGDGGWVDIQEREGDRTDRLTIREQGDYRVITSSCDEIYSLRELDVRSYSATEITYKPGEADPTFKIRHYNSKPVHLAASGLRTLARTVGGFIGPIFEKLGSIRIKFEMSPQDRMKAQGVRDTIVSK